MKNSYFLIVLFFIATSAYATDDSVVNDPLKVESVNYKSFTRQIHPADAYARTQAVFNFFHLPLEESLDEALQPFQGSTTVSDFKRILNILDPQNFLFRFSRLENDSLDIFLDRDSLTHKDTTLEFTANASTPISVVAHNLAMAKSNAPAQQLKGLRVAIDPGHMSTKEWDQLTGKYIKDNQKKTISEGMINLQTSLLLKAELEKLGAVVLVTREDHQPISKVPLAKLDLNDFGLQALRERSLESWFQELLSSAPAGPELFNAFKNHPRFQALFKESARANYFILREDLRARVDSIDNFRPDISLVIHYDALAPAGSPNGVNTKPYSKVKTYVHGSLATEEWATQDDRLQVLKHVLDPASWDASFNLSQSVVNSLSETLNLKHDVSGGGGSYAVAPGVFARNLFITRKMAGHAHTYIECLHYNDPSEFKALLQKDFSLMINGENTYYSKRLQQVVFGIRNGVVKFVSHNKLKAHY
jgi:N-acetylmuramoyl-L-alanine amidase